MMPQLNKESLSVFYNTKNSFTDKFNTLGTTSFHRTWLPNPCKRLMEVFNYGRLLHAYGGANCYSEKQLL